MKPMMDKLTCQTLFIKPDGLLETGNPAAKVVGKLDIRCVLYGVSSHFMTTQTVLFILNTAAVIVPRVGELATENFALPSGGQDPGHR